MKLIVINSFGPMGSTLVSGLLEHYGFLNFPLRKLGLHDYLTKKRKLNDNFLKYRFKKIMSDYSIPQKSGGVSVLDRDNRPLIKKIDLNIVNEEMNDFQNKSFSSIKDMYFEAFSIFNKSLKYKAENKNFLGVIELTNDIYKYEFHNLSELYKKEFEEVYFINIRRNFLSWLNSFVSQYYSHKKISLRNLLFRLSNVKKNFNKYETSLNKFDGALEISFDDIFIPNNYIIKKKIEKFLNIESNFEMEKQNYDLYGAITGFKKAFTKHDDNHFFLPKTFNILYKKIGKFYFKNIFLDLILDIIFQLVYLLGYIRFKR
tara:strand:+ start:111 stop:1058 length:948 start_codon:yes stop_codon:yes gene_type:complete